EDEEQRGAIEGLLGGVVEAEQDRPIPAEHAREREEVRKDEEALPEVQFPHEGSRLAQVEGIQEIRRRLVICPPWGSHPARSARGAGHFGPEEGSERVVPRP